MIFFPQSVLGKAMLEGVQKAEASFFCPGVRVGQGRVKAAEGQGLSLNGLTLDFL